MNKKSMRALLLTIMMVLANMGGIPTIFAVPDDGSTAFNVYIYTPVNDSTVTYCESPILIDGGFGPGLSKDNHLELYWIENLTAYEGNLIGWHYIASIEDIKDGKYKDWSYDWLPDNLNGTYTILALGYDGDHPNPVATATAHFDLVKNCTDGGCSASIDIDDNVGGQYPCSDLGDNWTIYGTYDTNCCFSCGGDSCKIYVTTSGPNGNSLIGIYNLSVTGEDKDWAVKWDTGYENVTSGNYTVTAKIYCNGIYLDEDSVEIEVIDTTAGTKITIITPVEGGPYDCESIPIEGNLSDCSKFVDYIEVYVNGELIDNITNFDSTWSTSFTPGTTNTYVITAYAMDMGTSLDCDSVEIYTDCECPPCGDISINMLEPATCGPCLCGPITFSGTLEGSDCVDRVDIYYYLEKNCNDTTQAGILEFSQLNGDLGSCPNFGTLAISTDDFDTSGNWEVEWNGSCDLMESGLYRFSAVAVPKVQDGLPCIYNVEFACVNNYRDISIDGPCGLICENTSISGTIEVPFCCNAVSCVNISYYDGCEWVFLGTTGIIWEDCGCGCSPCTCSCCDSKHGTWGYCIDPCTLPNGCVEIKAEAVGVCGPFSDTLEVLIGNGASVEICYPDDCDLLCGMETVSGEISMMCEPDCGCDVPVDVYISDDGIDWTKLNNVTITREWTECTPYPCINDSIDTQYKSWEVCLPTCLYEDGCYIIKAVASDSCGCESKDTVNVKINNSLDIIITAPEEGDNWYCGGGSLTAYVMTQCGCVDDIGTFISNDGGETWEILEVDISGPCMYHVDCDCGCCEPCDCYDECMNTTCPDCHCGDCLCDGYGFVDCLRGSNCTCFVINKTCGTGCYECGEDRPECQNLYTWKITQCFEPCQLEDGEYTIMVNASGPCGPVSESVTFTVDNSADLTILNDGCEMVCGKVNITGIVSGCLVDGIDIYYGCGNGTWDYLGTVVPYESSETIIINSSCGCDGGTITIINNSGVYLWSVIWDTCGLNGSYTIRANATDMCDNVIKDEVCLYVRNQIPTIEITGPGCDDSVCGLVTITGTGANCNCANGLEFYYAPKESENSSDVSEWTHFAYIHLDQNDTWNAGCTPCDCEDGTHPWYANLTTCGLDDGYYWIRAEAVGDCGSLVNETSCIYVNATVDLDMIYPNMDNERLEFSGPEIIRGTSENSDCIDRIVVQYHVCGQNTTEWWLDLGEATIDENGDWEYIWNTCEMENACYCVKAVAYGICPGHSAETEAAMVQVTNEHASISIESPKNDTETGLYGVIPVAGTLKGWKCVDAITVNARFIGDLEDEGDDGEWILVETIDPTGYDWSLGFNSYGIDNGIWEIKADATGFEDSYTEDSVYILINNSGDGIGATPLYAYYAEGSEYIIVKFSEPIEIIDENAVDETFELLYGDFGTGATMSVIDGNKVKIMLGSDADIDYIGLYELDENASAIVPRPGQTNLYSTDNHAPVSGEYEDIAAGMIVVTDGTIFSVPTFVNTTMMLEKAGIEDGAFVQYTNGAWDDLANCSGEFRPLIGYLYENPEDGVYEMPVYTTRQGSLSEVKVKIANDYNLLALNNNLKENMFENADAGSWLWSLTKSSSSFMYVGAIFDSEGDLVGTYEMSSARFKTDGTYAEVSPYTAYWIPYAGTDGDTFYGLTMA